MSETNDDWYVAGLPGLLSPPYYVYNDETLSDPGVLSLMATGLGRVPRSRREVPNWIADTLFLHRDRILNPLGKKFALSPDGIDLAFGNEDTFRWITNFLKVAEKPWKQKPQAKVLDRLRLIAFALALDPPKEYVGPSVPLDQRSWLHQNYLLVGAANMLSHISDHREFLRVGSWIGKHRARLEAASSGLRGWLFWLAVQRRLRRLAAGKIGRAHV